MNEKDLQNKILELESYVKETKKNITRAEENIKQCEKAIQALKDLAWDRQSKKESSSMYKVLKEDKTHTRVKSNVGDIKVDKNFMDKEIKKHLDNPNLRGMVTTQEMLSFPKVAKGVEANNEARGYTWQVKANDGNTLVYGSRKYETNNEKIHRLATSHSKTEKNERQAEVGGRSHPHHPIFNDFNFRKSAENIISQKTTKEAKTHFSQEQIKTMQEAVKKASQKLKENIKSIDIDLGKKI
ncbi:hypothetical protein YZ64_05310 [Campylobacter upsaliensis]|nr:hypothetical protein [Campylobacter upsaliensis]